MVIENPEVTLEQDGDGIPEGAGKGGIEWTYLVNVQGDDGIQYCIDCHMASYRDLNVLFPALGIPQAADVSVLSIRHGKGKVVQPPGKPYKITDFTQVAATAFQHSPFGALTIKKSKGRVAVDLGAAHLICKDDLTWHLSVEDKEKGIKVELIHHGVGLPTWYSDTGKLQEWSSHNIAYGYFWSGFVEGTLTIEGRKVGIKGKGVRQRCLMADTCPGETGGWHDWMWFHFDEMFGCLDELKYSKFKIVSLYLTNEKHNFPSGSFNIEHQDWTYDRQLGFFIPMRYKVTIETDAGVLHMSAKVKGYFSWGVTGEVPDAPFVSLDWEKLEGTFTYKDGRKKKLTNGVGGTLIRQWKPYPNVYEWFIPEIAEAK